jgi:OmpA-OmpF porin, OOP family
MLRAPRSFLPFAVTAAATFIPALFIPTLADAQEERVLPSLDLRAWDPPTDPRGGLFYEPASTPATADWNVALWNHYAYRAVTLKDPVSGDIVNNVVEHQVGGDLVFNVGFFERFSLGLDLPFAYAIRGDDATAQTQAVIGSDYDVPSNAVGDAKLNIKVTIVKPTSEEFGGFALAFLERLGMPTGNEQSYLGEGAFKSTSRLLAEYRYLPISAHVTTGVTFRASHEEYGCGLVTGDCATTFGNELPWGVSVAFRPSALGLDKTGEDRWFLEAFGHVPLNPESPFSSAALSAAQVAGGAKIAFANDIGFIAAVDAAMVSGVGTPPIRAHLAITWAPRTHDEDNDGVHDDADECQGLEEDHDGFDDHDGCPDWDNDDDGVPDGEDKCEGEKEDIDDHADDDGCVDPDNDDDGVLDGDDACPDVAGIQSADAAKRGCPDADADRDGVEGQADRCPDVPEDKDGFEDEDGCPDPDNDGDTIGDAADACANDKGKRYASRPQDDGCPDRDGDDIADKSDACPDAKGVANEDPAKNGCVVEEEETKPRRRR